MHFLHEDAKFCKYDGMCERNLCMFKHGKKNEEPEPDKIDAFEKISASAVDGEVVVIDREEMNENDHGNFQ